MKLFKYDNFEIVISEEAFCIKAFRDIWDRDLSLNKIKAKQELGFLYFLIDPRSDYMIYQDEEDRFEAIRSAEGLPKNYKFDKAMIKASEQYSSMTNTPASMLYEDTLVVISKLRAQLRDIDLTAEDGNGKLKYPLNQVTSTIDKIPDLIHKLNKANDAVIKELEENSRMRGLKQQKLLENGFDKLFG